MVADDEENNKKKFGDKEKRKLEKDFKEGIEKYTKDDLEKVLKSEDEIKKKFKEIPEKLKKMIKQVQLLMELLKDYWDGEYKEIPWASIASIVFCLVYFISPLDLIPDAIPVIGYIDDAYVVKLTLEFIADDLKKYCSYKEYDLKEYF